MSSPELALGVKARFPENRRVSWKSIGEWTIYVVKISIYVVKMSLTPKMFIKQIHHIDLNDFK